MTDRKPTAELPSPAGGSILYVTTVAKTIRQFLIPYAAHFRNLGWRVDAAARGVSGDPALRDAFDHVYELPLSRSIFDLGGVARGVRAVSRVLASRPDIVHVHTPIASFVTRLAVSRLPAEGRPQVAYAAHGFHFHEGGRAVTNAVFLAAERLAGRWTDRLIVINDEDYLAARRYRIVPPSRLVLMPGIGLDTQAFSRSSLSGGALAQARQELGVGADTPLLVVVAELSRNKRPADVIKALALMLHTEARLVFVGPGDQAPFQALAGARGLQDRVRFTGLVDDVRPLIVIATALVLPSTREVCPVPS
jgi:glycosyltransferase involved in cell wall biosynthesis